jgi:hypothetical protein
MKLEKFALQALKDAEVEIKSLNFLPVKFSQLQNFRWSRSIKIKNLVIVLKLSKTQN